MMESKANEMEQLKSNAGGYTDDDVAIDLEEYDAKTKSEHVRWDIIYLMYIGQIGVTVMTFGGQHDFKYSRIILFNAFIHFATEFVVSWHFLYSAKTAKMLSIISSIIIVAQAVCSTFAPVSILKLVFLFEFLMSDVLIFFGSICVLLNKSSAFSKKVGSQLKQGAFATSLH